MSWGTCYTASNNIHFDFPPIMSDGRNYASWQPGAAINEKIRIDAGIKSNWQYRKYLTENADEIIKYNQLGACDECAACPARYGSESNEKITTTPYLYTSTADNTQPHGYETSDLKNLYVSQYQLQARMVTPVITQAELLQRGYKNSN
jgi:hypothetical protein